MRWSYAFDAAACAGVALVFAGLWWMFPPLAVIVLGGVLTVGGVGGARLWAALENLERKPKADRESEQG